MRSKFTLVLAGTLSFATASLAQIPASHAVIATRLPGTPATQLLDADPISGAIQPVGGFLSDGHPPLAITTDPINDDLVLAVQIGNRSRFVRLSLQGLVVIREIMLADVAGIATDVLVAGDGDLYATFGGPSGGLMRIPRMGGPARVVAALPRATAIGGFRFLSNQILVAQSGEAGPPSIDPQINSIVLEPFSSQVTPWPNSGPLGITGFVDIPSALVRQLIAREDGTVSESLFFGPPQTLPITPQLPPGSTVAAAVDGFGPIGPLFLGGAAHPFLKTFDYFRGQPFVWQNLVGPLPGDPVDFDLSLRTPGTVVFGQACGAPREMQISAGSPPSLGNSNFELRLNAGTPNTTTLFTLGFDDHSWLGVQLPYSLPNGCDLLVAPDYTAAYVASNEGRVTQSLPIPNSPALQGLLAFAQWLQAPGGALFATSPATSIRLGN